MITILAGCSTGGEGTAPAIAVLPGATVAAATPATTPPAPNATVAVPEATATPTDPGAALHFGNPVMARDFPDPDAIKSRSLYYAYATNANGMNIQAASSPDLIEWQFLGNVLPRVPAWASKEFGYNWAPEVTKFGDRFVMYFTTRLAIGAGGVQCIALAISAVPEGPFLPTEASNEQPFVCQQNEGGSIDPSVFVDDDGEEYLLWKSDANSRGGQTWLYIQPLTADGLALEGEPARLITADARWEGPLVEAPTLWKHEGRYYLFYSAHDYRSRDYAVGYAVADRPAGPYAKGATNPVLKTTLPAGVVGPGGQDIVAGLDGKTYMLFHSWTPGGYRSLDLALLEWQEGVPVVTLPPRAGQE
jgi:beta-xylosidase